jgi:hypothetical protein
MIPIASRQAAVFTIALALFAPNGAGAAQPPSLSTVLERVRHYVEGYAADLSLLVGIEHYSQVSKPDPAAVLRDGLVQPPEQKTVAEFALVRSGDDWVGYRDVFEVNGKQVGDHRDRLQKLFLENPAGAAESGRRIANESSRYNIGVLQRNFNVPTLVLFFLQKKNEDRFKFKQEGTDTIDGTATWKVHYEEKQTPTIIRTPDGGNVPVSGTIWVDPADGRVLKTYMETRGEGRLPTDIAGSVARSIDTFVRVTVTYKADERLGMLVPGGMNEEYKGAYIDRASNRSRIEQISCKAVYSDFKKFETSGRVIIRHP